MDEQTQGAKRPNHKRNLVVVVAIGFFGYIALNAFGAVQCMSRGGDVQLSNFGVGCFQDYSDWRPGSE